MPRCVATGGVVGNKVGYTMHKDTLTVSVFDARMARVVLIVIDLQRRKSCRSPQSGINLTGVARSAKLGYYYVRVLWLIVAA